MKTATSRCKSISISAGGMRPEGYKAEDVAKWIIEAIHDHCEIHRHSSVRAVKVVIPAKDLETQQV